MTSDLKLKPSDVLAKAADLIEPEEWRAALGLAGRYEVSSHGRARSLARSVAKGGKPRNDGKPQYRLLPARPCNLRREHRGYLMFSVGESNALLHREVCAAFNGPPPFPGAICRHLDDNRDHNTPDNLAWGTHADNAADKVRNGSMPRGEAHYAAKLSVSDVGAIRAGGFTDGDFAARLGVSRGHVRNIRLRRKWAVLPEASALARESGQ